MLNKNAPLPNKRKQIFTETNEYNTKQEVIKEYIQSLESDVQLLFVNYNLYRDTLFSFIPNFVEESGESPELNENDSDKLCYLLDKFNEMFIHDINGALINLFINDNVIFKVIEIYLGVPNLSVCCRCLSLFSSYSATESDYSPFYRTDFLFKLTGSLNSCNPEVSHFSRMALCNFLLDKTFYAMKSFEEWLNDFDEIGIDDTNNWIRFLYALILQEPSDNNLLENIENCINIIIEYYECNDKNYEDYVPYFVINIIYNALISDIAKEKRAEILHFFTPFFIDRISNLLNYEDTALTTALLYEKLNNYGIEITSIFNDSLLIPLRSIVQNKTKQILLDLMSKCVKAKIWYPSDSFTIGNFINEVIAIVENGTYNNRISALNLICQLNVEDFPNCENIYHAFGEMLYLDKETMSIEFMQTFRDFLFKNEEFGFFILQNQDFCNQLESIIFDSNLCLNSDFKEVFLSIDLLMKKYQSLLNRNSGI